MKPVIKKQTHYNLLLMKDDGNARTFRLHSSVLRFLIFLFLGLMLGGGAGIAGGVYYWQKYRLLSSRHDGLDREAAEMRLQLERLSNLECLIVASNGTPIPQTRNEEVGASPRRLNATDDGAFAAANATAAVEAGVNATTAASAGVNATAGPVSVNAANSAASSAANATAHGAEPGPDAGSGEEAPASEAGTVLAASNSTTGSAAPDGRKVLPLESDGPVRIDGFHARPCGPQRVCLSYELSTVNPDEMRAPVIGTTRYTAVFGNGARLELPLQDSEGTRFNIQRMKPMRSSARLPQQYSLEDMVSLDVYVDISEGGLYLQNLPFSK